MFRFSFKFQAFGFEDIESSKKRLLYDNLVKKALFINIQQTWEYLLVQSSAKTPSIKTCSIMTFSIMTCSIMTLNLTIKNETMGNDTQLRSLVIVMLSNANLPIILSDYAECRGTYKPTI